MTPAKEIPLGTLHVGEQIGKGGFGVVHEARLEGLNLQFAVKLLNPSPFNEDAPAARRRFIQEAEMLMRLRHPYVIPIFGLGEFEGMPYILMERFEGKDLNAAREHATADNVLPFLSYVVEGIQHAHRQGIVHRDIKPSNLMTSKGTARILDFGVASWVDPEGTRLTRTDAHCVGDAFSGPELIENPKLRDPRCDIYSVGAVWFWLLTGKTPKGHNWQSALRSSVNVNQAYERVMLQCLDQLESRHQDAGALLTQLNALRSGEPPSPDYVSDEEAILLGVISCHNPDAGDHLSIYTLEQEVGGAVSKLRLQSAQRRLRRRGWVETYKAYDTHDEFIAIRLTEDGIEWVETNLNRIEELTGHIERERDSIPPELMDDDIPF